jgi:hypothetical protein
VTDFPMLIGAEGAVSDNCMLATDPKLVAGGRLKAKGDSSDNSGSYMSGLRAPGWANLGSMPSMYLWPGRETTSGTM